MGGYGSGGHSRGRKRTVNDCNRIDLNNMVRKKVIPKNGWNRGGWVWHDSYTGEQTAAISYEVDTRDESNSYLRLIYGFTKSDKKIDYKIRIVRTPQKQGGERLWLICPITYHRVSMIYLPAGRDYFASRYAYRLKYTSQSRSPEGRAIDRMWKYRNKLGGEDFYPMRMPGMHESTYERILQKANDAESRADGFLYWRLMALGVNKNYI